ncbi:hypothetical protein ONA23_02390 [Mycoplasmopsis cynos]|uniref:hypothetical protein n=1 Tax=Mycoplasmopsis cynos TaxID=171284 RepID=UPI0024CAB243|nr:hypothetical protein [Mycoplasmopsis cynos]WAM07014.1 hypothetical protein ONA23_02390 [Mycoplasmopsis cynos]
MNNDIKTYNGKIRDIQNSINLLRNLIDEKKVILSGRESNKENNKILEKEIQKVKDQINDKEANISEYEKEISKFEINKSKLNKEISSKKREIDRQKSFKKDYHDLETKIKNDKYIVKRVKSIKIEPKTKDDISIEIEGYFENNNWKRYQLSTVNIGEKTIISRSYNSIKNLFKGYIKEPSFFMPSLIEPLTVKINEDSKLIEDIDSFISKYNLNEKQ